MIVEDKCVDCGKLRKGQEGIENPRCYDCFVKWKRKQDKKNEEAEQWD